MRESLWEHLKILFYPLLAAALFLTRGAPAARAARLLCLPLVCALMLGAGWVYHIALRGEGMAFDLVLYGVLMALGFLLPRLLWPLGDRAWVRSLAGFLAVLVWVFLVWFTFFPRSTCCLPISAAGCAPFSPSRCDKSRRKGLGPFRQLCV